MTDVHASRTSSSTFRRLRRSLSVVAAIALLAGLLPAAPAGAASPEDVRIQNLNSGLCFGPAGGSAAANTPIVQYRCDNDTSRAWFLVNRPEGPGLQYQIRNLATGQCLSPAGGSSGVNVTIVQYTCDDDPARRWETPKAQGTYALRNVQSNLCLSPAGGSTGSNIILVQYTCDRAPARAWSVFNADIIQNASSSLCLTVAGGSSRVGVIAVQYACDGDISRQWGRIDVDYPGSGFQLKNAASGLCLSPAGGQGGDNVPIVQYHCDGKPVRTWVLVEDGYFPIIQNVGTGRCLSPAGGSSDFNVTIVQYRCDDHPARHWRAEGCRHRCPAPATAKPAVWPAPRHAVRSTVNQPPGSTGRSGNRHRKANSNALAQSALRKLGSPAEQVRRRHLNTRVGPVTEYALVAGHALAGRGASEPGVGVPVKESRRRAPAGGWRCSTRTPAPRSVRSGHASRTSLSPEQRHDTTSLATTRAPYGPPRPLPELGRHVDALSCRVEYVSDRDDPAAEGLEVRRRSPSTASPGRPNGVALLRAARPVKQGR